MIMCHYASYSGRASQHWIILVFHRTRVANSGVPSDMSLETRGFQGHVTPPTQHPACLQRRRLLLGLRLCLAVLLRPWGSMALPLVTRFVMNHVVFKQKPDVKHNSCTSCALASAKFRKKNTSAWAKKSSQRHNMWPEYYYYFASARGA